MRPTTVSVGPLVAGSGNCIALSQTPTGTFTLNGSTVVNGIAILDAPRRVLFQPVGDESANFFTLVGTDLNGSPLMEILAGKNAASFFSNLDFLTISSIILLNGASGALTVGTNGIASSQWVRMDEWASAQVTVQCVVSGTVNYTVQQTMQDPNDPASPVTNYSVTFNNSGDAGVVNSATSKMSSFTFAPIFVRTLLNSGTGSVSSIFAQLGVAPY